MFPTDLKWLSTRSNWNQQLVRRYFCEKNELNINGPSTQKEERKIEKTGYIIKIGVNCQQSFVDNAAIKNESSAS